MSIKISLAAARVNANLTQAEAAKCLRVSKKTIINWEKGISEPKMSQVLEISKLYNLPENYIFLPTNTHLK